MEKIAEKSEAKMQILHVILPLQTFFYSYSYKG